MNRKPIEFIRGLAVFLVLWAAAIAAVRLRLLFPHSVLAWLSQSPDPQQAMYAFAAMISSGLLILLRLGIELPTIKPLMTSDKVRIYLTGLPLWLIAITFALSVGGLLIVFPACQPPTSVSFAIAGRQDPLQPGDTLAAQPGSNLTLVAQPMQKDAIMSCKWQYSGDAFQTLGSTNGCEVGVELANTPGDGYLSVQASQDFCSQGAIFSLHILTGK